MSKKWKTNPSKFKVGDQVERTESATGSMYAKIKNPCTVTYVHNRLDYGDFVDVVDSTGSPFPGGCVGRYSLIEPTATFLVVYSEAGDVTYATQADAEKVASEMALNEIGSRFNVLRVVASVAAVAPIVSVERV